MKNSNIVIVDVRSWEYHVLSAAKGIENTQQLQQFTSKAFAHLLSGVWLEQLLDDGKFKFLFACDLKPYWRHKALSSLGCNYKGNRNKNASYMEKLGHIHAQLIYLLQKNDLRMIQHGEYDKDGQLIGYEADDIAATFIKLHAENCKHVYTLTVDADWLPFTSIPNVTWLGFNSYRVKNKQTGEYEYTTRVRDARLALEWWQNNTQANSTKAKRAFIKEDILDLWKFKAIFGDSSDNIRGSHLDQNGNAYLPYIDLWNPPQQYDLSEKILLLPYVSKTFQVVSSAKYGQVTTFKPFYDFEPIFPNKKVYTHV